LPLEKLVDRSHLMDVGNADFRLPHLGGQDWRAR
jgi:hypothetical protein